MLRSAPLLRILRRCTTQLGSLQAAPPMQPLVTSLHPAAAYTALYSAPRPPPRRPLHSSPVAAARLDRGDQGLEAPSADVSPDASGAPSCPVWPSALQICLMQHGVAAVSFWDAPRFRALTEEWVRESFEPKLAALEAQGMGPEAMGRLLRNMAVRSDSFGDLAAFLANLEELQALLEEGVGQEALEASPVYAPGLTRAGELMVRSPACLAQYLSGPPHPLPPIERWLAESGLGVSRQQLARWVWRRPCLLNSRMGPQLLEVLAVLDDLAGSPGWGWQLLEKDPLVAGAKLGTVRGNLGALQAGGYTAAEVCSLLERHANLLILDLSSPAHVQKFEWIRMEAGWPLDPFLSEPRYLSADLHKMASRLAFIREQGLPAPAEPSRLLTVGTEAHFCKALSQQLGAQLTEAQWEEWLAGWRESPAGRRWGADPATQ